MGNLKNIGPKSEPWLHEIGISTREDLEKIGVVMAYKMIRHRRPGVNVLLLYALQGALMDVPWNALPPALRARLRQEAQEPLIVSTPDG